MTTNTRIPLALLPALSLLVGWLDYGPLRDSPHAGMLATLYALASLALVFAWFRIDARMQQYRPSKAMNAGVIALAMLAIPCYLFNSRGARRGAKALGLALVLFVATLSCYAIGAALAR